MSTVYRCIWHPAYSLYCMHDALYVYDYVHTHTTHKVEYTSVYSEDSVQIPSKHPPPAPDLDWMLLCTVVGEGYFPNFPVLLVHYTCPHWFFFVMVSCCGHMTYTMHVFPDDYRFYPALTCQVTIDSRPWPVIVEKMAHLLWNADGLTSVLPVVLVYSLLHAFLLWRHLMILKRYRATVNGLVSRV